VKTFVLVFNGTTSKFVAESFGVIKRVGVRGGKGTRVVKEKMICCFVCFSWTLYTLYGAVTNVDFHEECGVHCAVFNETRCHSTAVLCVDFFHTEYYPNRKKNVEDKDEVPCTQEM